MLLLRESLRMIVMLPMMIRLVGVVVLRLLKPRRLLVLMLMGEDVVLIQHLC